MGLDFDFSKLDVQDVLDIAVWIEQEAQDRYETYATHLETEGNGEVAAFFRSMARREVRHREQLSEQRRSMFGDAPSRYRDAVEWDVEGPELQRLGTISLKAAFDVAMRSEQDAHDYYESALEQITDPSVTTLLDGLKHAELEHKRLLEVERVKYLGD